ncbi:response regulator transcription factor [Maribellus mangrovi]|uniref:response regulator transcription factor n=1 Tax=Maribellus mangrovi TaxID=3133146 RepID=UPI0030ECCEFE
MGKIALLEKFTLYGKGIKAILHNAQINNDIVQAKSIEELTIKLGDEDPDVVVFDICHCENLGIKALRKLRKNYSKSPVLLLVSQDCSEYFEAYIRSGVKGIIFDNADEKKLIKAILKLMNGEEFFSKKVWVIIRTTIRVRKNEKQNDQVLTNRELEIIVQFSKGRTYKEIAAYLNISPRTVEAHKRNILEKLNIKSTAEMIRYAFQHHISA